MKTTITVFFSLLIAIGSFAQVEDEQKEYSKKELKQIAKAEKKAKQDSISKQKAELTELMLNMHRFVLEADYVGNGKGQRQPVNSTLNFIAVDSLKAVIQLSTFYGSGHNGVGGITVDGSVTKYELKVIEGKRGKSYSLMLNVMTSVGIYDITLLISESGYTDATIRSLYSGQLTYNGNLVPIGISRVYKGSSI